MDALSLTSSLGFSGSAALAFKGSPPAAKASLYLLPNKESFAGATFSPCFYPKRFVVDDAYIVFYFPNKLLELVGCFICPPDLSPNRLVVFYCCSVVPGFEFSSIFLALPPVSPLISAAGLLLPNREVAPAPFG